MGSPLSLIYNVAVVCFIRVTRHLLRWNYVVQQMRRFRLQDLSEFAGLHFVHKAAHVVPVR